jgi:hypothetical protein
MEKPLPFPDVLFVSHYDHSTADSISLSACLTEKEAIEVGEKQPVPVAEYKLVRIRLLSFEVKEHDQPL